MARDHVVTATCDVHAALLEMDDVPATEERLIPIGTPPRRVDVCDHCTQLPMWRMLEDLLPWLSAVWEHGVDVETPKRVREPKTPVQQEQLPAPEAQSPSLELTSEGDAGEKSRKQDSDKIWLICPLAEEHRSGKPEKKEYVHRADHAHKHGLKVWDIAWEDPDGRLTDACTSHQVCIDHNLRFKNRTSVIRHVASARLSRIDQ